MNPNIQQHIQPMSPHTSQQQNPQMLVRTQQQQQQQQITKENIHEYIKIYEQKVASLGPGPYNHQQQSVYDKYNEILTKLRAHEQQQQQQNQQTRMVQQQQQPQMQQHHFQQPSQPVQLVHTQQHYIQQQSQPQQQQQQPQQIIQITQHQSQQQQSQQQQQANQQHIYQQQQQQQQHTAQPQPLQQQQQQQQATQSQLNTQSSMLVLEKSSLQSLVKEVDPSEQLDEDVEDILLQIADDFIENVINESCQIAKHRKSNILEIKDVQFHLERKWNLWIPGFGLDDLKPFKKSYSTEAHRQRLALIKKSTKLTDTKEKNIKE